MKRTFTKYPSGYIKATTIQPEIQFEYDGERVYDLMDQVQALQSGGTGVIDDWGIIQLICGNVGLDYNFAIDNSTGEMINQSAFYYMTCDPETGIWDTDTSKSVPYTVDFDDPDWVQKAKDFGSTYLKQWSGMSPADRIGAASETSGAAMRRNKRRFQGEPTADEAQLLATEGGLELWQPLTFEGSVKLGRLGDTGTDYDVRARWDTCYEGGGDHYFNVYTNANPLYIMVNRNDPHEKYQYWGGNGYGAMLADIYDNVLTAEEMNAFFAAHPQFAQIVNYTEA